MGTLVGKTLLTSTSNPYAAGGGGARLQNTPAALDVFGIQVAAPRLRLGSQMHPPPHHAPTFLRQCVMCGASCSQHALRPFY